MPLKFSSYSQSVLRVMQAYGGFNFVPPSHDTTGVTDSAKISASLVTYQATMLQASGRYYTSGPVLIDRGHGLMSLKWRAAGASGLNSDIGCVISPGTAWAQGAAPLPQLVTFVGSSEGGSGTTASSWLAGIEIDGTGTPAGPAVDGIGMYGNANNGLLFGFAVNRTTGHGVNLVDGHAGATPDGWHLISGMINNPGADGVTGDTVDMVATDVHVQGHTSGRGWYLTGSNCRLVGCRADQGLHGFVSDAFLATGNPAAGIELAGCGTQGNKGHAVWAWTSAPGAARQPLLVTGGTFFGDGADGVSPAFMASGLTTLLADGITIIANTNYLATGSPAYGIGTEALSGNKPVLVRVRGKFVNAVTGVVSDLAPAQLMSYDFHGYQGGVWPGNIVPTLYKLNT